MKLRAAIDILRAKTDVTVQGTLPRFRDQRGSYNLRLLREFATEKGSNRIRVKRHSFYGFDPSVDHLLEEWIAYFKLPKDTFTTTQGGK